MIFNFLILVWILVPFFIYCHELCNNNVKSIFLAHTKELTPCSYHITSPIGA